jgi:hypothetical protein
MFTLSLEYMSAHGMHVSHWLPVYDTMVECEWWRNWFIEMLKMNEADLINALCEATP